MFVSGERAGELARDAAGSLGGVRTLDLLRGAGVGKAELVRDLRGEPAYWLVPFFIHERVAGFARVLGDGRVAHIGAFGSGDERSAVTGIDSSQAGRIASGRINSEAGESASEPVFVHDGPIGREAWLVEVRRDGRPIRWIFVVSPSSVYERPAGTFPGAGE